MQLGRLLVVAALALLFPSAYADCMSFCTNGEITLNADFCSSQMCNTCAECAQFTSSTAGETEATTTTTEGRTEATTTTTEGRTEATTTTTATEAPTTTTTVATAGGSDGDAECDHQNIFDVVMCDSYMCSECTLAYCAEECQKLQHKFPLCKCSNWVAGRTSYSQGAPTEGLYGDVGEYGR
mmetsp:Transcript_8737/g.15768  ORF Transcript_8737/g.15768 Transcript_8737/m.15768 type:complete len:182 (+) Transcript_8737:58-603(+)